MKQPDLDEIATAMETQRDLADYFWDKITGEVVW